MFDHRPTTSNFRFRFRSEPGDPRKDDVVRSVPLSRKQIQRRRWALGWMVAKCLAVTAVVICLLTFAARIWHESITVSPSFAVGDYSFHSNVPAERGGLTKDVISDVTGLRADLNVMKVDLTSLQTALTLLPQVQTAVVQRIFPNRIDIRVTERQPVAWLACASREILPRDTINGRLLDEKGVVFECRSLLHPYNHLPVVNVPNLAWLQTGQALTDRRALQALSLIKEFNHKTWSVPLRIQEILLENEYAQTVTMTDGATVIFGTDKVPAQMERLAKIYQWAKEHDRSVATAQLITELNVPVTFARKTKSSSSVAEAPKVVPTDAAAQPVSAKRPPVARDADDIRSIVRGN